FDKKTPIICMSANVYKEDKLAAEESGMNDFIEKPLEKADIESKLLKLIHNEFDNIDKQTLEPKYEEESEVTKTDTNGCSNMKAIALNHLKNNFNDSVSNRLFNKALSSIAEYVRRINANFQDKNIKELVEDFHALKGVLSNIGIKDLASKAGELQKISEKGDFMALVTPKNKLLECVANLLDEREEESK
ncbi:MAG TPA: response regulator, partial [Campylobacterales bacterium]|nr:response regulator [Campylobacterales bacterium]